MLDRIKQAATALVTFEADEWDRFATCLKPMALPEGRSVIREGEVARYVGFVEKGCLRAFYTRDGAEHAVNFFLEGDFFADCDNLAARAPSSMSIQAVEPSELLVITLDDLDRLHREVPAAETLGRRLAELHFIHERRQVMSLLSDSAETRYRNLMNNHPDWLQRIPQYMIASYLGMTPETLSRVRRRIAHATREREMRTPARRNA